MNWKEPENFATLKEWHDLQNAIKYVNDVGGRCIGHGQCNNYYIASHLGWMSTAEARQYFMPALIAWLESKRHRVEEVLAEQQEQAHD